MPMKTKISIITAVYNGGQKLQLLINSISLQEKGYHEFIIIDGGSKDDTLKIIKQNKHVITKWISEPDKGIYDAWNKGLKLASGEWIMFLGCDDILVPDALQQYDTFLSKVDIPTDYISSRVKMVDSSMNFIRIKGWEWEWPRFLTEMTVAHPGSLHAHSLFTKYGPYDTSYKIVGDYEFLLRPGPTLKTAFLNSVTVVMNEEGVSNSISAIKEHRRAIINTGKVIPTLAFLNFALVFFKFYIKNLCRRLGVNVYYRK